VRLDHGDRSTAFFCCQGPVFRQLDYSCNISQLGFSGKRLEIGLVVQVHRSGRRDPI
jgi:hypothetical protein